MPSGSGAIQKIIDAISFDSPRSICHQGAISGSVANIQPEATFVEALDCRVCLPNASSSNGTGSPPSSGSGASTFAWITPVRRRGE